MHEAQIEQAKAIMKSNLTNSNDWIVLSQTMETLAIWSKKDDNLKTWLLPELERLQNDERKSVSGKAKKLLKKYYD